MTQVLVWIACVPNVFETTFGESVVNRPVGAEHSYVGSLSVVFARNEEFRIRQNMVSDTHPFGPLGTPMGTVSWFEGVEIIVVMVVRTVIIRVVEIVLVRVIKTTLMVTILTTIITISSTPSNQETDGNGPDGKGSDTMFCRGRNSSLRANTTDKDPTYKRSVPTGRLTTDSPNSTMTKFEFETTFGIRAIQTRMRWI